jgi:crotonobetainyl-CoA:carnitine CoA-transferase CaiB-like acyl-CoA transferase
MADTNGWLRTYRAIDLTDERGLLAGQMLARFGMDVIQVEPPAGSSARRTAPLDDQGGSFYWSAYAAGKRGITLDWHAPAGQELLLKLLDTADFLFETEPPARRAALGLSPDILAQRNPRLIHVSITPFGSDGPKRDYADSELILWAAGGPLHPNRDTEGPPLRISVPQAYLHAAADAAAGAMIAHFARLRTGRGQHVDISVQQSVTQATLASHLAVAIGHPDYSLFPVAKAKPGSDTVPRKRRTKWVVRDGLVEMGLRPGPASGAKANNLFDWMRQEGALPKQFHDWDWITLQNRIDSGEIDDDQIDNAYAAIATFLADRTKSDLMTEALNRKILLAPINNISDLLTNEQLKTRNFFTTVIEDGHPRTLPGRFAQGPAGMFADPRPAPTLGQHNEEIFAGLLGLTSEYLAHLIRRGVI